MNKYHYVLLRCGKEPNLILGNFYGADIHIPIPPEISFEQTTVSAEPPPLKYETYKYVCKLYYDIDVYELESK